MAPKPSPNDAPPIAQNPVPGVMKNPELPDWPDSFAIFPPLADPPLPGGPAPAPVSAEPPYPPTATRGVEDANCVVPPFPPLVGVDAPAVPPAPTVTVVALVRPDTMPLQ